MKKILKFGLVGIVNTLLTIISFNVLIFFQVNYLLANMIAYGIGMLNSYVWNKSWVFEAKQSHREVLYKFILTNFIVLAVNNVVLYLGVRVFLFMPFISQLMGTTVGMMVNFFMNKNWTFVEKSQEKNKRSIKKWKEN